jgi:hypothetical protein
MSTVDIISPELNYSAKVSNHSSPLYLKLQPINNVTTFAPSLTSVYGPVEILIPSKVLSLKNSRLTYDVTIPAQASSTYTWMQSNALCMLDRIVLTTQNSNQILADIPNLNRYSSMLTPVLTQYDELLNKPSPLYCATGTQVGASQPIMYSSQAIAQQFPLEDVSRSNSINNFDGIGADGGVPYGNIRKCIVSSGTATANALSFQIPLESIQASILDIDQLLYFSGEQVLMSLYFAPVNRYAWGGTSQIQPYVGAIAPSGTWAINNLTLYLYTEQNLSVSQSIVQKVMSQGVTIPFPYPFIQRQALAGSTLSLTQQLTRGFGSKLLFAAVSAFNGTTQTTTVPTYGESNNSAQDHSLGFLLGLNNANVAAQSSTGAFTSPTGYYTALNYNTYIDNIPILTNSNMNFYTGEHWLYNKKHLKGSCIQSINDYNQSFVHIDSFLNDPLCKADWTAIDGLDMDAMHQYSITFTGTISGTTPTVNLYVVFCCQKTLHLTPTGVTIS